MARVRADDYDLKAKAIMDAAADLFSKAGYPGTNLNDIAKAYGGSKSMLYHYFPTKDDLLFAMSTEHLEGLIAALEAVSKIPGTPEARFLAFLQSFIDKSSQTRQRNMVALNEIKYLPKPMLNTLKKREVRVVELARERLQELNPHLAPELYKPYTLLLLGTLNWTDTWYRPRGDIKPKQLVEHIANLFLNGFMQQR